MRSKWAAAISAVLILTVLHFPRGCAGHRILSLFLMSGRSNLNYFEPIHLELVKKGHSITVISPVPCLTKHANITEYPGLDFTAMVKKMLTGPTFFENRMVGNRLNNIFSLLTPKFSKDCDAFHELPAVQKLIAGELGKFDLVMTYGFINECVYGLMDHLNASTAMINTLPAMFWLTGTTTGTPTPLSFVPVLYFTATEEMGFMERVGNVATYLQQTIARDYVYIPAIEGVYRKYLPNAAGVKDVERNMSLVMAAGHPAFGPKRPTMPDLIDDLGGLHCRPADPLQKSVQDMITDELGQEQDFVFFSLGSVIHTYQIPVHIREGILKTFAKFPRYRFLWKWESNWTTEGIVLPANVRFAKWFPQQDLLGHAKCRLFITHGGCASTHESIYHGVPMIGIPFFTDQDWNMRQVEKHGIGKMLELRDITEENLTKMLEELLGDPKYTQTVHHLSQIFRDRQVPALERAVWNIEYVLRHGGAPHLRSPARHLNLLQYYCIDVIFFFVFLISAVSVFLFFIMRFVFRKLSGVVVGTARKNIRAGKAKLKQK